MYTRIYAYSWIRSKELVKCSKYAVRSSNSTVGCPHENRSWMDVPPDEIWWSMLHIGVHISSFVFMNNDVPPYAVSHSRLRILTFLIPIAFCCCDLTFIYFVFSLVDRWIWLYKWLWWLFRVWKAWEQGLARRLQEEKLSRLICQVDFRCRLFLSITDLPPRNDGHLPQRLSQW